MSPCLTTLADEGIFHGEEQVEAVVVGDEGHVARSEGQPQHGPGWPGDRSRPGGHGALRQGSGAIWSFRARRGSWNSGR